MNGQTVYTQSYCDVAQPSGKDLAGRFVLRGEDLAEVALAGLEEAALVGRLDAHQVSQHVQGLALANRHVTGQVLEIGAGEHAQACTRGDGAAALATQRAGGDAEGLVAEGAVGGHRQRLEDRAGLACEDHGAEAAAGILVFAPISFAAAGAP